MRKLNREDFIERAKTIHRDKFKYDKVMYFGEKIKVTIICLKHGDFKQSPSNHIRLKQGCPMCYGNKKLTTKEFIKKSKLIHGEKYSYDDTIYDGNKIKVSIICKKHGVFNQAATRHLCGDGCAKCNGGVSITQEEFIKKAKLLHGKKYDYELVEYKNSSTNIKLLCEKHGLFEIKPRNHISKNGQGCKKCANKNSFLSTEEFIDRANKIHLDLYEYTKVNYQRNDIPIVIVCKKHGEFMQKPNSHLNGRGCRICKNSKGELKILNWLSQNNIKFETQKEFEGCFNVRLLKFDFYLPESNMVIEFDGEQHNKSNKFFGGDIGLGYRKNNDKIKNQFLKLKNINFLRISYKELRNNRIEKILSHNITQLNNN